MGKDIGGTCQRKRHSGVSPSAPAAMPSANPEEGGQGTSSQYLVILGCPRWGVLLRSARQARGEPLERWRAGVEHQERGDLYLVSAASLCLLPYCRTRPAGWSDRGRGTLTRVQPGRQDHSHQPPREPLIVTFLVSLFISPSLPTTDQPLLLGLAQELQPANSC